VLVILPVCVLAMLLLRRKQYGWLAALLIAYLGIGFPLPVRHTTMGPAILLYLPRLPLMFALLLDIYVLLWRDRPTSGVSRDWTHYAWATVMAASVVFGAFSIFRMERAVRQEYAYRLPLQAQGLLNTGPRRADAGVRYIALSNEGYRLITEEHGAETSDPASSSPEDDLSFSSGFGHVWVERSQGSRSQIVDLPDPRRPVVDDAEDPMISTDGQSLAFLRGDRGRLRLMARNRLHSDGSTDVALTLPRLNVYEASFMSPTEYAFSAADERHQPQIYLKDATHMNSPLDLGEARYPALSPDGRWMAYSRFDHGAWNLWLRDQASGAIRRVADVPCNQIEPAWEDDSKTLLYSTDCGRSLWFTAIARRRVIP
jgi:hypothetical protein